MYHETTKLSTQQKIHYYISKYQNDETKKSTNILFSANPRKLIPTKICKTHNDPCRKFEAYPSLYHSLQLVYGVKRHFQQYFSYIVAVSFIGGGNPEKTTDLSQITDKLSYTT
jgi:hypothetical protein